jgi:DNA-binding PadR family transcriptional regulator
MRPTPLAMTVLALLHYGPLHPYGLRRLVREWGKDAVVNVEQPTSLYRTIDRLTKAGLVAVHTTSRDQQYPERTVYEITDDGRRIAREWLGEMLRRPRNEYPEFPAALSLVLMLERDEIADELEARASALADRIAEIEAGIEEGRSTGLPRIARLEDEHQLAVTRSEHAWVTGVVKDLRSGALTWSPEELVAYAERQAAR